MTLHGKQATITSDYGTKMVVAQTIKNKITFYPHKETVTMTAEEVLEMVKQLTEEPVNE